MNNTGRLSIVIGVMFVMLGALINCTTPATPEESCLSAAKNVVKESKSDDGWPIAITDVSVINSEPILCKGTATQIDDTIVLIQFFENADEIGFESLPIDERQCDEYLTNQIIEFSKEQSLKTGAASIIKIYNPEEISNTGNKLTCEGEAKLDVGENEMIEFFYELDEDLDSFIGYEGK